MYKRILIVLDDQAAAQTALRQGVEVARAHHASVIFLYVLPADPHYAFPMVSGMPVVPMLSAEEFKAQAHNMASRVLMAASAHAESWGVLSTRSMGSGADAAEYVALAAVNRRCGLIVVASERKNAVMRLLNGSIVPGLITKSSVPVMVCPHDDPAPAGALLGSNMAKRTRRIRAVASVGAADGPGSD
ncbi:MAG: universal stress protein [Rhodoferax sp.]|uniref:universal stress protein n=1 Tax=Rhodoferax sp. TaxID=50421 RepID=UPI00261A41C2|nr:universal stress protein [Rhodoferax sp.]MDD2882593.1 universal stress protein [Rhodoferax sp.]